MSQTLTTQLAAAKLPAQNKPNTKATSHPVSDLAIRALQASSIDAIRRVDVSEVDSNHLVLTGRVSTFYFKQQAQELVRQAVRNAVLVNDIEVF